MTFKRLYRLFQLKDGVELSEDNDQDVKWLVRSNYLSWDDDKQQHRLTASGRAAIRSAVEAVK